MSPDPPNLSENHLRPPVVLSIAGSDCSCGAGAQADLKTFAYFQTLGLTAITSVVAEVPGRVVMIEAVSPEVLEAQLNVLSESFQIRAVKTGMLANAELCTVVADFLENLDGEQAAPIVVDPVLIASSGDSLLEPGALALYRQRLLPLATLATPNLNETAALLGIPPVTSPEAMDQAARKFTGKYQCLTLIKGGHLEDAHATDVLWDGTSIHDFSAARIRGKSPSGTGCTLSAAIAALLAHDYPLLEAIAAAKEYLTAAIAQSTLLSTASDRIEILNHFPHGID